MVPSQTAEHSIRGEPNVRWLVSLVVAFGLAVGMLGLSVVLPGQAAAPPAPLRPPTGLSHLTRTQAVTTAGATGGAADARLMDYESAAALLGEGPNPAVDPTEAVWVVTVTRPSTFTVILNGVNGAVIDSCVGCRTL
jgi:hypothetical protein